MAGDRPSQSTTSESPSGDGPTQYGFDWGPMSVERLAHIDGRGYVVSIKGPKGYSGPQIQVLVSEKGQAITAFPSGGAKVSYRE